MLQDYAYSKKVCMDIMSILDTINFAYFALVIFFAYW